MTLKIVGKLSGYNNCYHFHAAPKYRQHSLVGNIAARLDQLLREKSHELGWKIHAIAVDSDHAHFLIESSATPSEIAQRLFGFASFMLRKEFPALKEINTEHFWGGRQCKPITDQTHFDNTLSYIGRHAQALQ